MGISYKKLWKLLIDRDLKKKDLTILAGIGVQLRLQILHPIRARVESCGGRSGFFGEDIVAVKPLLLKINERPRHRFEVVNLCPAFKARPLA